MRIAFYEFDDTDPTRAPESTALTTADIELPLVNDGDWHELWADLPDPPPGANAALVAVGLAPPQSRSGTVWIDGLQVVEWRPATQLPPGAWIDADYLMASESRTITLEVRRGQ